MPWVVALTKPNHEAIAAVNLRRQAFDYYYPRYVVKKPTGWVVKPLFPRYIFILIQQKWRSVGGTSGISYLLMGHDGPSIVQDKLIKELQSRENEHGHYQLAAPAKFQPGQPVKTTEGPFAGAILIYEGMLAHERVSVLIEAMGRQIPIEMKESDLVAA